MKFASGQEPPESVRKQESFIIDATTITAAELVAHGLRGAATAEMSKDEIKKIKDKADALAKDVYERVIKKANKEVAVRVSEGFGRDALEESFKAAEVINFGAGGGREFAIIDVLEGTNAFVEILY
jgi:hypothetical protein